jgi:hypothetical protein
VIREVRQVLIAPRAFFSQLPDAAAPTFPLGIASIAMQLYLWLPEIEPFFFSERQFSLSALASFLKLTLPISLLFALLAPVILAVAWAPVRFVTAPGRRAWQIAGATFVPGLVITPVALGWAALPISIQAPAWWFTFVADIGWSTALVYLGVRSWLPTKAHAASAAYLIAQVSITLILGQWLFRR